MHVASFRSAPDKMPFVVICLEIVVDSPVLPEARLQFAAGSGSRRHVSLRKSNCESGVCLRVRVSQATHGLQSSNGVTEVKFSQPEFSATRTSERRVRMWA